MAGKGTLSDELHAAVGTAPSTAIANVAATAGARKRVRFIEMPPRCV
ncbi:MAG TPA: hypothetical protein VLF14_02770 [Candidatus Binatia bacterium]|nr:hypothetical protein [Candidatus Binatia bacterium]